MRPCKGLGDPRVENLRELISKCCSRGLCFLPPLGAAVGSGKALEGWGEGEPGSSEDVVAFQSLHQMELQVFPFLRAFNEVSNGDYTASCPATSVSV